MMGERFAKGRGLPGCYRIGDRRFGAGEPVPGDAPKEDIDKLRSAGYIVAASGGPVPATPTPDNGDGEPAGGEADDEALKQKLLAIAEAHGVSLARMKNPDTMRAKLEAAGVDVDEELSGGGDAPNPDNGDGEPAGGEADDEAPEGS